MMVFFYFLDLLTPGNDFQANVIFGFPCLMFSFFMNVPLYTVWELLQQQGVQTTPCMNSTVQKVEGSHAAQASIITMIADNQIMVDKPGLISTRRCKRSEIGRDTKKGTSLFYRN
uniref:Uncharacterized protein n=2 Tax=Rhizophora mucronata TaxID=61149 RepID=A0A2P2JVK7_RHIMU